MMSKSVVMHYVRNGVRGENYYETVDEALKSGMIDIENEISVPQDIVSDGVVVYTEHEINAKFQFYDRRHAPKCNVPEGILRTHV